MLWLGKRTPCTVFKSSFAFQKFHSDQHDGYYNRSIFASNRQIWLISWRNRLVQWSRQYLSKAQSTVSSLLLRDNFRISSQSAQNSLKCFYFLSKNEEKFLLLGVSDPFAKSQWQAALKFFNTTKSFVLRVKSG